MNHEPRHEKVVKTLVLKIFTRQLSPGDKLPPERELATQMDIDRTSLRVALKQLESMRVLSIRPGDGVYVNDYLKTAGIDFLRMVFMQDQGPGGDFTVDPYTVYEIWEFWAEFFPIMMRFAARRVTPRDIKALAEAIEWEDQNSHDPDKIVEANLKQEDMYARATGNIVFQLFANASAPVRRVMIRRFIHEIGPEAHRMHVAVKRAMVGEYLSGKTTIDDLAKNYRKVLLAHLDAARNEPASGADVDKMVESYQNLWRPKPHETTSK